LRLSLSLILDAVNIGRQANLPLFEIALVRVRFDHVASFIVNANRCIM
jgi:hypothetical protein